MHRASPPDPRLNRRLRHCWAAAGLALTLLSAGCSDDPGERTGDDAELGADAAADGGAIDGGGGGGSTGLPGSEQLTLVAAGGVVKSAKYKMVFAIAPMNTIPMSAKSTKYQLVGGLVRNAGGQ